MRRDVLSEVADTVVYKPGRVLMLAELSFQLECHLLDAAAGRSPPGSEGDATEVTAAQLCDVAARLAAAGHWREGDPGILTVPDSGLRPGATYATGSGIVGLAI